MSISTLSLAGSTASSRGLVGEITPRGSAHNTPNAAQPSPAARAAAFAQAAPFVAAPRGAGSRYVQPLAPAAGAHSAVASNVNSIGKPLLLAGAGVPQAPMQLSQMAQTWQAQPPVSAVAADAAARRVIPFFALPAANTTTASAVPYSFVPGPEEQNAAQSAIFHIGTPPGPVFSRPVVPPPGMTPLPLSLGQTVQGRREEARAAQPLLSGFSLPAAFVSSGPNVSAAAPQLRTAARTMAAAIARATAPGSPPRPPLTGQASSGLPEAKLTGRVRRREEYAAAAPIAQAASASPPRSMGAGAIMGFEGDVYQTPPRQRRRLNDGEVAGALIVPPTPGTQLATALDILGLGGEAERSPSRPTTSQG